MVGFQSFEDIDAWQKARKLTNEIYVLIRQGSFSKVYGLRDQIQREEQGLRNECPSVPYSFSVLRLEYYVF